MIRRPMLSKMGMLLRVSFVALLLSLVDCKTQVRDDSLNTESVVLISGAASYLGTELALALYSTYKPKLIILVDDMEKVFPSSEKASTSVADGLARLEFQRQRLFRVLQETAMSDSVVFYRVDLRPQVPEFRDTSVVSVLEYVLEKHARELTHIVHIPEEKNLVETSSDSEGRGSLFQALLEQLRQWSNVTRVDDKFVSPILESMRVPHLTFSSSSRVYSGRLKTPQLTGTSIHGREDQPIKHPPRSLQGTAYLMDEILAQTYYDLYQIDSVALRFFSVYGPFDSTSSQTFQMAEQAILSIEKKERAGTSVQASIQDYIFVDDAVDAILSAMQVRAPPKFGPLAINVGSGQGTQTEDLIQLIKSFVPGFETAVKANHHNDKAFETSGIVADTERAKKILGWEPRVSLQEGILQTLGWHFDRAYPRGKEILRNEDSQQVSSEESPWHRIAMAGRLGCKKHDKECLRRSSLPIFPCASECAHSEYCHSSFWDDVWEASQAMSQGCSAVWYTVDLDMNLKNIPSVQFQVSPTSIPRLRDCNFAFVAAESPLVQRARRLSKEDKLVYENITLIPVLSSQAKDHSTDWQLQKDLLNLVPKISPGRFFADSVDLAIYSDSDVLVDDMPALLNQAAMQPFHSKVQGGTGLLIGLSDDNNVSSYKFSKMRSTGTRARQQHDTYQTFHIKASEVVNSGRDGFGQRVDSSLLVHRLQHPSSFSAPDARFFRCDVMSELWSWKVASDEIAFSFVAGLHDLWSQVIVKEKDGIECWWHGQEVQTVEDAAAHDSNASQKSGGRGARRLQEVSTDRKKSEPASQDVQIDSNAKAHEGLRLSVGYWEDEEDEGEEIHHFDHNGFGVHVDRPGSDETAKEASVDSAIKKNAALMQVGRSTVSSEGTTETTDPSKDDTWLSMLSSGETRFFVRLVRSELFRLSHVNNSVADEEANVFHWPSMF